MKKLILILLIFIPVILSAEGWSLDWYGSLRAAGSSGEYMPFWARTGENGILPVKSSGLLTAGTNVSYRQASGFVFEAGTSFAGALAQQSPLNSKKVYGLIDRLYVSGGWKMLKLDVGLRPSVGSLNGLSVTVGDILSSGNAIPMPGVNLSTDWIYFEKGQWVGVRGNLAHLLMIDNRHVSGTKVHNKSIALKFALGRKVDLIAGFNHYAQWGGENQGESFKDFIKVFFAMRRDGNDSGSGQTNVYGNHMGNEWARAVWRAKPFTMTLQYDKLFEDYSGISFKNFPDGVWTLQIALNERKGFVTDINYEFINTTWQSEDKNDEKDENGNAMMLDGSDNYFNSVVYNSGWTHFGRTIGLPLMVPSVPNSDGKTNGIVNNRVRGHHFGLGGVVAKSIPYRLKATFTENFGTHGEPLEDKPWQLSMAMEVDIIPKRLPVSFSVGIYGDSGEFYQNCAGLTLRIFYRDSTSFRSR